MHIYQINFVNLKRKITTYHIWSARFYPTLPRSLEESTPHIHLLRLYLYKKHSLKDLHTLHKNWIINSKHANRQIARTLHFKQHLLRTAAYQYNSSIYIHATIMWESRDAICIQIIMCYSETCKIRHPMGDYKMVTVWENAKINKQKEQKIDWKWQHVEKLRCRISQILLYLYVINNMS